MVTDDLIPLLVYPNRIHKYTSEIYAEINIIKKQDIPNI